VISLARVVSVIRHSNFELCEMI